MLHGCEPVGDQIVSGFWSSDDGRRLQWQQRRLRSAHVLVEQQPAAEGICRQARVQPLPRDGAGSPLGPARMATPARGTGPGSHVHHDHRQPPTLARLPKNYLDLLGANAADGDPRPLLYNDDGAVGMLFASAHNLWSPVTAAPGTVHPGRRTNQSRCAGQHGSRARCPHQRRPQTAVVPQRRCRRRLRWGRPARDDRLASTPWQSRGDRDRRPARLPQPSAAPARGPRTQRRRTHRRAARQRLPPRHRQRP